MLLLHRSMTPIARLLFNQGTKPVFIRAIPSKLKIKLLDF